MPIITAIRDERIERTARRRVRQTYAMRPRPIPPGPGQESVWDYPRPPRVEPCSKSVVVVFAGAELARSERALRVLETAGPPTIYVPAGDVAMDLLRPAGGHTLCEWKGWASYFDAVAGDRRSRRAAWAYEKPRPGYEQLRGHLSFYPARVDLCLLGGERVRPQPGDFYGGWITDDVVGPFKGEPGSTFW